MTPLDRNRWVRGLGRRIGKRIKDRANLMIAQTGPDLKLPLPMLEAIVENALVTLVYASELQRLHVKAEKAARPKQLPLENPL